MVPGAQAEMAGDCSLPSLVYPSMGTEIYGINSEKRGVWSPGWNRILKNAANQALGLPLYGKQKKWISIWYKDMVSGDRAEIDICV